MFDDLATTSVRAALTGLAMRQRVSANNIANVQTPGFIASKVNFEESLGEAVRSGEGSTAVRGTRPVISDSVNAARQDGNNVNIDEETVSATDTNLRYQLMLRALDNKYSGFSAVLKAV
ncbi:flagellar basal body rod protein FlgB [Actinosynnema pretiosum subsp. pretiosum]|uniref:Flagellar basal body rod protein FlgB n=2 Tax=Actinosynnema TaxID=40566 RepID=C6WJR5_ACTMD|nr:flagellar basal body rod protein FlgB [Actinosynnema mirum]ACU36290.1 flagellar basal-body rod protein FlgB [Actinosynnema mirum DSM 43827]QUF06039.1 flagellar basal body rod protein FlgB [Actinosynnema pretiosum subsp. pretiosum]